MVRIYDAEKVALQDRARKAGYSVADYLRSREGFETELPPKKDRAKVVP